MGAKGFSITVRPIEDRPTTDLTEVQALLWECLTEFAWDLTSETPGVWESYLAEVEPDDDDRWFETTKHEMTFWFPDFAGTCSFEAGVAYHWIRTAHAARFDAVVSLLQEHGWQLEGPAPQLAAALLDTRREFAWIELHGTMFELPFDGSWETEGLHGEVFVPPGDVPDEDAAALEAAAPQRLCRCPMCVSLRADPRLASGSD